MLGAVGFIPIFIFIFVSETGAVPTGAGISIIVPDVGAGEFIPEFTPVKTPTAENVTGVDSGVATADSAFALVLSFFFLLVAIKMIKAISNNKTPPVINNPGIVKNQSKLKFI